MKKLIILIALGLILSVHPVEVFAKTICFAGGGGAAGTFWYFSGGKPDQKPFSGNLVTPPFGTVPAWASIITGSVGNTYLSTNSPHNPSAPGLSVWITVSGATTAVLSGFIDVGQDGTFDSAVTMIAVNCSSIPTAKPKEDDRPQGALAVPEKSEK